jgi:hypothetical protein
VDVVEEALEGARVDHLLGAGHGGSRRWSWHESMADLRWSGRTRSLQRRAPDPAPDRRQIGRERPELGGDEARRRLVPGPARAAVGHREDHRVYAALLLERLRALEHGALVPRRLQVEQRHHHRRLVAAPHRDVNVEGPELARRPRGFWT